MDIEKAKEISSSLNWKEVCEEIDYWIHSEVVKLRSCTPEQLAKIQLTIATLEKVKNLPEVVIDRE